MIIVDSHCHLTSNEYDRPPPNLETILTNAKKMNVEYMLSVSTCMPEFSQNLEIAESHTNIFCSIGVHPSHSNEKLDMSLVSKYLDNKKTIAIGEVGLDYFYSDPEKGHPTKLDQQRLFHKMLSLSKTTNLPYIFHARDCYPHIFDILSEYENINGVFHCYTDNIENAKKIIDKGLYISVSGIITFKNSSDLRKVLRYIPLDRLLIETDSPYLSPIPFRGQINEPAYVRLVAEKVSEEKKIKLEEIAETTTRNFFTLFSKSNLQNSYKK